MSTGTECAGCRRVGRTNTHTTVAPVVQWLTSDTRHFITEGTLKITPPSELRLKTASNSKVYTRWTPFMHNGHHRGWPIELAAPTPRVPAAAAPRARITLFSLGS